MIFVIGGEKKNISPAGNWTPVSRVTGGDTDHYTTEEEMEGLWIYLIIYYK